MTVIPIHFGLQEQIATIFYEMAAFFIFFVFFVAVLKI